LNKRQSIVLTVEEIGAKYGPLIAFQQKMPIGLSLMGDYSFIIRSEDKVQLMNIINFIWETV